MQAPTSLYLSECSMMLLLLKVLEGPFLLVTSSIAAGKRQSASSGRSCGDRASPQSQNSGTCRPLRAGTRPARREPLPPICSQSHLPRTSLISLPPAHSTGLPHPIVICQVHQLMPQASCAGLCIAYTLRGYTDPLTPKLVPAVSCCRYEHVREQAGAAHLARRCPQTRCWR